MVDLKDANYITTSLYNPHHRAQHSHRNITSNLLLRAIIIFLRAITSKKIQRSMTHSLQTE
ncbi:hypothetical protein J6590_057973, partial [Homalodisca vitripennis]